MPRHRAQKLQKRLREFNGASAGTAVIKSIDDTYRMLSVVDDKSASLLQFNGLLIAGNALLFTADPLPAHHGLEAFILGVILLSALSCLLCFWTVRISWPFLRRGRTLSEELDWLCAAVEDRRELYQWSWGMTLAASVAFILIVLYSMWLILTGQGASG
jgi:hypothetical protein